jgi:hypothetical protein
MTIISEPKRTYRCDICGKEEPWGPTWVRYSSILLDDECPDQVPHACSEACGSEMKHRVDTGVFVLPVLKMHGYSVKKISGKRGY